MKKLQKQVAELSMSINMMNKMEKSPELIRVPKKNKNKKGLKNMIKYAEDDMSDDSEISERSPERRLNFDTEQEKGMKVRVHGEV